MKNNIDNCNSDDAIHSVESVKSRAFDKVYSKFFANNFRKNKLEKDIKIGSLGGITEEDTLKIISGIETEIRIWSYIMSLIEKDRV